MKERLEQLLAAKGYTSQRFAEIMGVQPSGISHILAGRNKPRYDFLERLLRRFPDISPDWLLLGRGPMFREMELPGRNAVASLQFTEPEDVPLTIENASRIAEIEAAEDSSDRDEQGEPLSYSNEETDGYIVNQSAFHFAGNQSDIPRSDIGNEPQKDSHDVLETKENLLSEVSNSEVVDIQNIGAVDSNQGDAVNDYAEQVLSDPSVAVKEEPKELYVTDIDVQNASDVVKDAFDDQNTHKIDESVDSEINTGSVSSVDTELPFVEQPRESVDTSEQQKTESENSIGTVENAERENDTDNVIIDNSEHMDNYNSGYDAQENHISGHDTFVNNDANNDLTSFKSGNFIIVNKSENSEYMSVDASKTSDESILIANSESEPGSLENMLFSEENNTSDNVDNYGNVSGNIASEDTLNTENNIITEGVGDETIENMEITADNGVMSDIPYYNGDVIVGTDETGNFENVSGEGVIFTAEVEPADTDYVQASEEAVEDENEKTLNSETVDNAGFEFDLPHNDMQNEIENNNRSADTNVNTGTFNDIQSFDISDVTNETESNGFGDDMSCDTNVNSVYLQNYTDKTVADKEPESIMNNDVFTDVNKMCADVKADKPTTPKLVKVLFFYDDGHFEEYVNS